MAASTPARSEEAEVVIDACLGNGANIWRGVSRTFSHAAVNSPGFFTGMGPLVEIVLSYLFLARPSIVRVSTMVPALARFLSLRYTLIVKCFLDATKFPQFGRHFNQSLREFLNFLLFS